MIVSQYINRTGTSCYFDVMHNYVKVLNSDPVKDSVPFRACKAAGRGIAAYLLLHPFAFFGMLYNGLQTAQDAYNREGEKVKRDIIRLGVDASILFAPYVTTITSITEAIAPELVNRLFDLNSRTVTAS